MTLFHKELKKAKKLQLFLKSWIFLSFRHRGSIRFLPGIPSTIRVWWCPGKESCPCKNLQQPHRHCPRVICSYLTYWTRCSYVKKIHRPQKLYQRQSHEQLSCAGALLQHWTVTLEYLRHFPADHCPPVQLWTLLSRHCPSLSLRQLASFVIIAVKLRTYLLPQCIIPISFTNCLFL